VVLHRAERIRVFELAVIAEIETRQVILKLQIAPASGTLGTIQFVPGSWVIGLSWRVGIELQAGGPAGRRFVGLSDSLFFNNSFFRKPPAPLTKCVSLAFNAREWTVIRYLNSNFLRLLSEAMRNWQAGA